MNRTAIAVVGVIVGLPVVFASLGGSGEAGLIIGIVFLVIGLATWIFGSPPEDRDPDG